MSRFWSYIFISLLIVSCLEAPMTRQAATSSQGVGSGAGNGNGNNFTGGDDDLSGDGNTVIAKVEVRHLIEPKVDSSSEGGDYKRKLTLPKNYNGFLYLAGINVSTLSSRSIKVRFKFGQDKSAIEIPATVSTAPGLTPQTNVEVLVLDLRARDFQDVQLIYDLYDYNEYDFTGTEPDEPVADNRDDNLFCRGLNLADDPTFTGSVVDSCSGTTDVCKYAYAKVLDKGLVINGTNLDPIIPSEGNIESAGLGYYDDADAIKLNRCLPDNPLDNSFSYTYDLTTSFLFNDTVATTIDGVEYFYQGPYLAISANQWELTADAVTGDFGIFGSTFAGSVEYGYQSKLFPLYSRFELPKDTQYLGSQDPDGVKELLTMAANDTSSWMDGCNSRVRSVDEITGEHIGSCNVTAEIEVVSTDDDGVETIVDITDEVKLQLVKEADINTDGSNVLLTSFQQCSSSSQCGSDACCINNRCWSKNIVSQCIEDLPNYGNLETGEVCNTDYECSSLCCNKISGRCAPHDTIASEPVYCSKPSGQSCVAKEWCQKHPVTTCGIVRTGTDPFGNVTCALRCITAEVFGECSAADGIGQGICVPPQQPQSPTFDPNDPNRCNPDGGLLTLEQLIELANNPQ